MLNNPVKVYFENSCAEHVATMEDNIYSHPKMQEALEAIKVEWRYDIMTDALIDETHEAINAELLAALEELRAATKHYSTKCYDSDEWHLAVARVSKAERIADEVIEKAKEFE